jgi:hypothetical protein
VNLFLCTKIVEMRVHMLLLLVVVVVVVVAAAAVVVVVGGDADDGEGADGDVCGVDVEVEGVVGFVADKVALGQISPRVLPFPPISFIPPVLHY